MISNLFSKAFFLVLLLVSIAGYSQEASKLSISGISSGAFMATQMGIIFSDQIGAVASVAGGSFYCARNHMQEEIVNNANTLGDAALLLVEPTDKFYDDSFNPFGIFQKKNSPEEWFFPSESNPLYQAMTCMKDFKGYQSPEEYLSQMVSEGRIADTSNIRNQKILIYQGSNDKVVTSTNANHLEKFYKEMNVPAKSFLKIESKGGHTFPTDKEGLSPCESQEIPYVSSCQLDLAGEIFNVFLDKKLERAAFNNDHLYRIDQPEAPVSLAKYGYLYTGAKCLQNPGNCHMHVALHGCQMSDSFDFSFQKKYEAQVQFSRLFRVGSLKGIFKPTPSLLMIEDKKENLGLLKFAMQSGLAEYAEKNELMILFPQTWITGKNFPYNPKGCWDWFGWTGDQYANNEGKETKWLMNFIQKVKNNPSAFIQKERPDFKVVQ